MNYLVLVIVLSAVTYRVARFVVLDTLVENQRFKVYAWLLNHEHWFFHKIHELLSCPYCITIWISGFVVGAYMIFVGSMPMPVFTWLAVATGSLLYWRAIDYEQDN